MKRFSPSTPARRESTGRKSPASRKFFAMQIPLVMTVIAPDRTGLVESIARAVAENGGNWLESRMCRLGGEFAGILRVEIPSEKKSDLLATLQKISGLNVTVRADEIKISPSNARQTKLEIV